MKSAAKLFEGRHDFISFSDDTPDEKSTIVVVENISITEDDMKIYIRIQASHFLWKMVRRIVGTLVEVGRGNLTETEIRNFLKSYIEEPSKYTAPPSGLLLEEVLY
jgi:tRNA pseudouridine38-40 synthase